MIQQNEVILLLLGIGVLIFLMANRGRLHRLPASRMILLAFYVLLGGWLLTNLEAFLLPELFNLIEHLCYAASGVLLAVWSWKVFGRPEHSV